VDVASFAEIAAEFQARVARIAWATVATVGPDGAPRTRILHPIWEDHIGWIATTRGTLKIRQIGREPRVSLTYWDPLQDNVHIEAVATVTDDVADKSRIWDLFAAIPPPLGYAPSCSGKAARPIRPTPCCAWIHPDRADRPASPLVRTAAAGIAKPRCHRQGLTGLRA
jgi:hypothetical protein